MELNTITLSDFTKLAGVIWAKALDSLARPMRDSGLFNVIPIPNQSGNTREFSHIDTNEYLRLKGESDQAPRAVVQQGQTVTMTHRRFAENLGISYEMRTQNKYPEVVRRLSDAARKGPNKIDLDTTHRFTFGDATSYVDADGETVTTSVGDGLALFSTAHTLRGSSSTYRNIVAGNPRPSKGAFEAMERTAVENSLNQLGEKVALNLDVIWTTDDPQDINTVREYLRSVAAPDFSNSGVTNVYLAKWKHVVLPRLATDANGNVDTSKRHRWGLADTSRTTAYLGIWEEPHMIAPSANSTAEDVQTDDWDFRIRTGFSTAILDAAWVYESAGDDSA